MKRSLLCLFAVFLLLFAAGCSGQAKEIEPSALAKALAEGVPFDSELDAMSEEQIGNFITIPQGAKAAAYMSDGSTAEEIFIVQCASSADADSVKAEIETLIADQKADATRYNAEEAARIEKAVFQKNGNCVILCIASDPQAVNAVIQEFLK